jgi:hypothetical protein
MDTAGFFYVLFLVFFLAIGGIVFGAWVAQARAAKQRARAARARKAAARNTNARTSGLEIGMDHADSLPAANSNVVTESGDSAVQVNAGAVAPSERSKLYWDFWEQFVNRVGTEHPAWTKRKTSTRASRYNLPTGTSAVFYSTAFTQRGLCVQLYFSSPDAGINSGRFEALRATKEDFERALGRAAEWDDKPGKKAAAIGVKSQFDNVADVNQWPAMLDWVLDQHVRLRQAVEAVGGVTRLKGARPYVPYAEAG